jgi:short-subunit dehydrogenase
MSRWWRDRARLAQLAKELEHAHGVSCAVLPADLTVAADLERIAAAIEDDAALE